MKHALIAGIFGLFGKHLHDGWNVFGFDICLGGEKFSVGGLFISPTLTRAIAQCQITAIRHFAGIVKSPKPANVLRYQFIYNIEPARCYLVNREAIQSSFREFKRKLWVG